ncbi:capsular polysaccharide biosynthesis protein [Campylobacter sp. 2014D-0259]|uniref:capsular polysaccharide biosynthesis protein n=1 Tax=Campylobacter sp. 2014D-0259 TaxID=1595915 RepID=UPI0011ADFB63|nr:capsular polysaccharide biosynthesis protein [Campylobacter sp. 2014D-0259]EAH9698435.1 capsular polysaccharide biosynthesis protein [Campylobacter jejuni]EAI0696874.1 capsular polysaccharide biosynthesis protein [Campylobacter jejuni]EAJ6965850.1 capsular polysaccharide biosynthesis protein [Campylobacter jejuni]EAK3318319.1 capsular polysaccharide biosynthesis protein [Campylobacter jejuni]EAL3825042.1 capsular polysaccharide biosynthesis protein [Campylobacter jejuni]
MKYYSTSKKLITNVKNFYTIFLYKKNLKINKDDLFFGWGRKKSGLKAMNLAKKYNTKFILLEDGFIRSLNLGVENSPSFSMVKDDIGIYYDATMPSKLENLLNTYEFKGEEIKQAKKAIELIKKYKISKYNNNLDIPDDYFQKDEKRVLIIAQTANDASLEFGLAKDFKTVDMVKDAIKENPDSKIYIKIHPDVLSGKKQSDLDINSLPKECILISENFNPIALLEFFDKVYTKTSGMGFEALIQECECVCYGMPFYAGWGLTKDKLECKRRMQKRSLEEVFYAAYILYSEYFNPYLNQKSNIFDTIQTLAKYKSIEKANSNRLFMLGFTLWKRYFIKPFFKAKNNEIIFLNSIKSLARYKLKEDDKFFIWGKKYDENTLKNLLLVKAKEQNLTSFTPKVSLVEDGFIRSISLGSDLTRPFSLIVDDKGLYIDPNKVSKLEELLQNEIFDKNMLNRAKNIIKTLLENRFSKYNGLKHEDLKINAKIGQKVILIPAQVEDDASMILGGFGLSTLDLLKEVRSKNQDAYIIFKPHPDVLSGNRVGLKDETLILEFCDEIVKDCSIDSAIKIADEIHTITSTSGFDALLRAKKVFTYGMPFYAGWGLTKDKYRCERRTRKLSLEELVAGALITYPRYINPKTKTLCEIEVCLDIMLNLQKAYFSKKYIKLAIDFKTFILRKIRRFYEFLAKK